MTASSDAHGTRNIELHQSIDNRRQHKRQQDGDQNDHQDQLGQINQRQHRRAGQDQQGRRLQMDKRRRSSSATVERLMLTCGTGAAPPPAFASMSGSGCLVDRIVQKLIGHFAYGTRNHKIPSMILLLCPRWKIVLTVPSSPSSQRILAIDFGARKIGLAVSDELGLTAQGLADVLPAATRKPTSTTCAA